MKFRPEEVLFSPTAACNLACGHCSQKRSAINLPKIAALKFLKGCKRLGVRKVGFTGGEPFLAPGFLEAISRAAVSEGLSFDRIMTNGVWFRNRRGLERALRGLREAGYDGDICVSVDRFHRQAIIKLAVFIRTAVEIWARPDIVSIACVAGPGGRATKKKLIKLSKALGSRLIGFGARHCRIRGRELFIKVLKIDLSPVGRTSRLKDPWDGRWFKDDLCRGPGNVFNVMPDGDVKPCCGYAIDGGELTIGNILSDTAAEILKNARGNRLVRAIFETGLGTIRKRLERSGVVFPGKTSSICYFCGYILKEIPRDVVENKIY